MKSDDNQNDDGKSNSSEDSANMARNVNQTYIQSSRLR